MTTQFQILDFIWTAKVNGITGLSAYLPRNHPLVLNNMVRQIRKPKDVLAQGFDELGNRVVLTTNGTILQF